MAVCATGRSRLAEIPLAFLPRHAANAVALSASCPSGSRDANAFWAFRHINGG
ncbi:MAG: hypothetical protein WBX00_30800 [Isosphaeraceae bacterium]